jgi:queuine/archaeosine tRNA-ribosyltransferase
MHNLHFLLTLMAEMRAAISVGRFDDLRRAFLAGYERPDQETRHRQHAAHRQRLAAGLGV